ncbi:glycoside hydrolase family 3 N-terminal domain-containing protein [Pontixanthobacter sp. CEM42]|uniref:glycoside hydrolase family 3 protein n=1 Tax=Pontixanthobacter sp. CEM42 TaxID=2792077 RepID=UPI001ADFC840|nr:glycoside hydrolase family 3 N-terminal domain-containing protein [Pontixanthobacter sp. CEM42]
MRRILGAVAGAALLAGCSQYQGGMQSAAATPAPAEPVAETGETQLEEILSAMSLERKVAQLIQPQINSFTADDMRKYRFGSYLNGGNGGPYGDEFAPASEWLKLADEMWDASTAPLPNDEPAIPTMWGTDAVHGHTNVKHATIFPHNIGLGATRDADLVRKIGAATATEIEVTGIDWNFSPTVAVARDDRWGRTYESYSEDPQLVAKLGAALVEGLQGARGAGDYLGQGRVVATAKHFFGDGGTDQGVDQGDVNGDIDELKSVHVVPYPAAISAGVETIMASFNSINGTKMHGNKALLTGVLRDELGFEGLVVGDWNAHGQIKGCTTSDCPQALLAGLDIYMVPDDWKDLHTNLIKQVQDGTIPIARLDEAVMRVLKVKQHAGLIGPNAAKPSARPNAGQYNKLGFAPHRDVAREAVAKSQVILKNNGVLPIKNGASILVAGKGADSIAQAAGGWTLTWQGGRELTNDYFPGATSIWAGLEAAAKETGGTAILSANGSYEAKPDVAIVVFGEEPYAEFVGDQKTLVFSDEEGLELLRKFEADGIPAVALFLSGRPMWMNREINAADAFVASWLPGSEGAGIADVLYGKREATGRLSFSWPSDCGGAPLNGGGGLFSVGYGLALGDAAPMAKLDETCGYLAEAKSATWYDLGRLASGITASAGGAELVNLRGEAGGIVANGFDYQRQEDARDITFGPAAKLTLAQQGEGSGDYRILYNLEAQPAGTVTVTLGDTAIDVTAQLRLSAGKGWREMIITEDCAPQLGNSLSISSDAPISIKIARIARQDMPEGAQCSF